MTSEIYYLFEKFYSKCLSTTRTSILNQDWIPAIVYSLQPICLPKSIRQLSRMAEKKSGSSTDIGTTHSNSNPHQL